MNIASWLAVGAVAGWTAHLVMGREKAGLVMNTAVGVGGAALGDMIAALLGLGRVSGVDLFSVMAAIAGSCLLLAAADWIRRLLRMG